jgi:hypothetical protein
MKAGIRGLCGGFDRQRNGYRMACKPPNGGRHGMNVQFAACVFTYQKAVCAGVPGRGEAACPGLSPALCLAVTGLSCNYRIALRNALGAHGVKLGAALDAPPGDMCSPAHRRSGAVAGGGQHFPEEISHRWTSTLARSGANAHHCGTRGLFAARPLTQQRTRLQDATPGVGTVPDKRGDCTTCSKGPGRSAGS